MIYAFDDSMSKIDLGSMLTQAQSSDETTDAELEKFMKAIFLLSHPVGSSYFTKDNINPAEKYGGEWEKIEGKFLFGADDKHKVGSTGGTESNDISHTHSVAAHSHTLESHSHTMSHTHTMAHTHSTGNHTLTKNELPKFSLHSNIVGTMNQGTAGPAIVYSPNALNKWDYTYPNSEIGGGAAHNHGNTGSSSAANTGGSSNANTGGSGQLTTNNNTSGTTTGSAGSTSLNNMPPYLALNMWIRTA